MREEYVYLTIFHSAVLILTHIKYDKFIGLICVLNFAQKFRKDKDKALLYKSLQTQLITI